MSILGLVGLILPLEPAWHQVATGLLYAAMLWLGFALAVAHLLRREPTGRSQSGEEQLSHGLSHGPARRPAAR
jgi:hypothetical protein